MRPLLGDFVGARSLASLGTCLSRPTIAGLIKLVLKRNEGSNPYPRLLTGYRLKSISIDKHGFEVLELKKPVNYRTGTKVTYNAS